MGNDLIFQSGMWTVREFDRFTNVIVDESYNHAVVLERFIKDYCHQSAIFVSAQDNPNKFNYSLPFLYKEYGSWVRYNNYHSILLPIKNSVSINTEYYNTNLANLIILSNNNSPIKEIHILGSFGIVDEVPTNSTRIPNTPGIAIPISNHDDIFGIPGRNMALFLEHWTVRMRNNWLSIPDRVPTNIHLNNIQVPDPYIDNSNVLD
jgi:hypothetical protein